ncbi:MAG: SPOR domain-containing protein [Xanthomonadales bacterium]|nr:SPOR domain-containing protein [Xanthomonadales bacterium]
MDPTLRNRLIGASVLIVAAAIVLPILLSSDPPVQQASQTRPLDIPPAPDPDMRRTVLPLAAEVAEADRVAPVDITTGRTDGSQTSAAAGTPEPAPPAASATTPAPPASDTASTATPPPAASTPVSTPATAPVATSDDGRFWVSLGGYGQAANADRVVRAAQGAGFQVQRESAGNLTRLRTGPYATRAQAEQARQRLISAVPDARPEVIELARTADTGAPEQDAASSRSGAWAVQVGAFGEQANARQLSERLRQAGFPAFVEARGDAHVVRVGPYVRRTEAESQRQRLRSGQDLADALIVAHAD